VLNVVRRLGLSPSSKAAPYRYTLLGRRHLARNNPVKILQQALSTAAPSSVTSMTTALETIIEGSLWQLDRPFKSFGDFAVALPPGGLGVRSVDTLRLLRHALLTAGYFHQWTEILERAARPRGRPRKKLANDEGFEPFYTIPTAATARDRLLLALKRDHPEHFAAVCALKLSPRAAALQAGLIAAGPSRYGGACNIVAAATLNERAQGRLLCDLFQAMSANAQCALIARTLEPCLGFGLAQRWRGKHRD
jgi:hypothetical protein